MTEETKKNLLDYMLGKMPSESGVEDEIFQSINNIPRDGMISDMKDLYKFKTANY